MTGAEVIEEIKRMPDAERQKVIQYARFADNEQLTPDQLGELTRQMVEASDPAEAERLKREIIRGFYGTGPQIR